MPTKKNLSFLDNLAEGKDVPGIQLNASQKALIAIAGEFALNAGENLRAVDSIASGELEKSVVPLEPVVNGKRVTLDIEVASYYDFVNKGVKGWKDKKGSNSKYQFKKPVKRSGPYTGSSKMVNSIRKWLIKEKRKTTDKSKNIKKFPISERERKRGLQVSDTSTKTAIKIAGIVRRQGLRKTGFWDKAVATLEQTIDEKVGLAAKIDIINSF